MKDLKMKLCRSVVLVLFLSVLALSAYCVPEPAAVRQEEPAGPELTIWVDAGNQLTVRMALHTYTYGRANGADEFRSYYPQLRWKLEDKSYLTGEQLRQELAAALEEGRGPDLILMDEVNGADLRGLMESGRLMALEENVTREYLGYHDMVWLDGTLEQGQMNGRQYILPIYVQCPVVFGLEDALEEAGVDPEGGYGTLEEFLEGMLSAAEASGKQIFEDVCAVDWLEQYAMPQTADGDDAEQDTEKLEGLLARVRECSGTEDSFYGPYESMTAGKSLLSGCGFGRMPQMAQNAALLGADRTAFLAVPAWDGEVRAVVTQAAAVNADTAWPKEAVALLRSFQSVFVSDAIIHSDYSALGMETYWDGKFKYQSYLAAEDTMNPQYAARAETIEDSGPAGRRFLACTRDAVTDAVYQTHAAGTPDQTLADDMADDGRADVSGKKVLTVMFGSRGMGSRHPLYGWLSDTAEQYADDSLHIQIVPLNFNVNYIAYEQEQMEAAQAGMDIILDTENVFDPQGGSFGFSSMPADLTPYLEEGGDSFRTIDVSGRPVGLLFGVEKRKDAGDRRYGLVVSAGSVLKEEAFGFCTSALKNEGYERAVLAAGYEPVNRK